MREEKENLYLGLLLLSHGQWKTHLGDFDCVLRTTENLFLPSVPAEARGALVGKTGPVPHRHQ